MEKKQNANWSKEVNDKADAADVKHAVDYWVEHGYTLLAANPERRTLHRRSDERESSGQANIVADAISDALETLGSAHPEQGLARYRQGVARAAFDAFRSGAFSGEREFASHCPDQNLFAMIDRFKRDFVSGKLSRMSEDELDAHILDMKGFFFEAALSSPASNVSPPLAKALAEFHLIEHCALEAAEQPRSTKQSRSSMLEAATSSFNRIAAQLPMRGPSR